MELQLKEQENLSETVHKIYCYSVVTMCVACWWIKVIVGFLEDSTQVGFRTRCMIVNAMPVEPDTV